MTLVDTQPQVQQPPSLTDVLNGIPQITNDYLYHKRAMFEVILHTKAQRVLEAGTDVGDSARIFAHALRMTGGALITVDKRTVDQGWAKEYPNVKFVVGDSLGVATSQPLDVLYLDDHNDDTDTKTHVGKELDLLGVWVRKGGFIIIDDTCHDKFGPGVTASIRTWCAKHGLPWYEDPRGHGMAFIEVLSDLPHA